MHEKWRPFGGEWVRVAGAGAVAVAAAVAVAVAKAVAGAGAVEKAVGASVAGPGPGPGPVAKAVSAGAGAVAVLRANPRKGGSHARFRFGGRFLFCARTCWPSARVVLIAVPGAHEQWNY